MTLTESQPVAIGKSEAPRSTRYASLDFWRGVACLMVVLLHSGHYAKQRLDASASAAEPIGARIISLIGRFGIGTQIFFVISGFCIAASVCSSRRKGLPVRDFLVRRFRRIYPPYWVALVLVAGLAVAEPWLLRTPRLTADSAHEHALVPPPADLTAAQWVGNVTLTETWRSHFVGDPELKLFGPAWTLCYEEQFYVICGLLLLIAPWRFFGGVVLVTGITFALVLGTMARGETLPRGFFFDGRWILFAVGTAVYWHLNSPTAKRWVIPLALCGGLLGSAYLRYGVFRPSTWGTRQLLFEWVVGFGFALLLLLLYRWDLWLAGARAARPIAFCGRMCYSLYLIHWPVTLLLGIGFYEVGIRGIWPTLLITIPIGTALSVFASWLFFGRVERRFLNTPSPKS